MKPVYKHIVAFDKNTNKITIHRMLEDGTSHLYTEIDITRIDLDRRTLQGVGQILGEALVLDMNRLRDQIT